METLSVSMSLEMARTAATDSSNGARSTATVTCLAALIPVSRVPLTLAPSNQPNILVANTSGDFNRDAKSWRLGDRHRL